jgi:formate hydrogenlyase transcriptional activator
LAGVSLEHFGGVGTEVSRQGSDIGWVLEHRTPLLRHDLEQERQFAVEAKLLAGGIRSYIVVPLITKDKAFGTLNVGSLVPNQYGEGDAFFLGEVAKQVALAVENVLAYEEIALLKAQLEQESLYLQEEIKTRYGFDEIIGRSAALKKVLRQVEQVAPTDSMVLISGETGTGKELLARAVHNLSRRKDRPLVTVNCGAISPGLVESELFGHEKGAFTGALARKIGRFELADGGTIFLDEIGDMPLDLQVKLLRVLQEGQFERVGG